ncbi:radical SAM protein [Paenibacillus sp. BR2-3]|uniref:B12-binding domain-containing radical SAM protein n=1 Tax=Paenibacillus sp. BR2-3 TaxID=3048494 RepID=UPI0039776406
MGYDEIYDIILIQPPLFINTKNHSESQKIESEYWESMEKNGGKLLGDLPVECSYGILSIASYIKKFDYKVKIVDFHLMDFHKRKFEFSVLNERDIVNELSKYKSKLVGISVVTSSDHWANFITNQIKKLNNDAYIFWGGYYPTNNDLSILRSNKNIDFIVRNEGEYVVKDILDAVQQRPLTLSEIEGLSYLSGETMMRKNASRNVDFNELPFLDYSLIEDSYLEFIVPRVYTTRGCKNNCYYCTADNSSIRELRQRSVQLVVDEIEHIMTRYNKNFFVMGDLEFLLDTDYSKMVCEEIIHRNLNVKWWCQVYPPHVEEEVIKLMVKAGNIQIALGIESSNVSALEEINKKISTDNVVNTCRLIKKYNIQIQAYIMIGLPRDTVETCINTIKYVGNLIDEGLVDVTHFSIMTPYPGSILFKNSEKYNIKLLDTDPNKYLMNCDLLGSGIPPYETGHLSDLEIYCLWLLALAHSKKYFDKKTDYKENYHSIYQELGLNNISVSDQYKKVSL